MESRLARLHCGPLGGEGHWADTSNYNVSASSPHQRSSIRSIWNLSILCLCLEVMGFKEKEKKTE